MFGSIEEPMVLSVDDGIVCMYVWSDDDRMAWCVEDRLVRVQEDRIAGSSLPVRIRVKLSPEMSMLPFL